MIHPAMMKVNRNIILLGLSFLFVIFVAILLPFFSNSEVNPDSPILGADEIVKEKYGVITYNKNLHNGEYYFRNMKSPYNRKLSGSTKEYTVVNNNIYAIQNHFGNKDICKKIESNDNTYPKYDIVFSCDRNGRVTYYMDFQEKGEVVTKSFDNLNDMPKYVIIDTKTGDEHWFYSLDEAGVNDKNVFQTLIVN
jgi:hypothetical protein